MDTQKIGRTKRAKLISRAIAAGYSRYTLIELSSDEEERHDNEGGLTIDGRDIYLLGQTDARRTWGYMHRRSGQYLVGVIDHSDEGRAVLAALRAAFPAAIDDSYCHTQGFDLRR